MASERFDRGIIQVQPAKDFLEQAKRLNEALRRISERIAKLEGRSGKQTVKNSLSVRSDSYTLLDMESQLAGKAAFSGITGTSRTFEIAKGARRDTDRQWVATDTGAVILQMKDDGTMIMYADTGLTIGAAFNPTTAITLPTGTAPHGLVSSTHTATGLTIGSVLTATATNTFAFTGFSGCLAYTTATTTLTNDAYVLMSFESEYFDTGSYHDAGGSPSRFTPPSDGYYGMRGRVRFAGSAGGLSGYKIMTIEKSAGGTHDNTKVLASVVWEPVNDANVISVHEINAVAYLTTGDYVELFAFRHEAAGNGATALATNYVYREPNFAIWRMGS